MKWMCMPLGRYVLAAVVGLAASLGMAAPQPPDLRLPKDVQPEQMRLDLTLSPEKTDYSGKVEVDLRINTAVDHLWLNATKLNVRSATLVENGRTFRAQVVPGGEDLSAFNFLRHCSRVKRT
jgi:aminopeptidase N